MHERGFADNPHLNNDYLKERLIIFLCFIKCFNILFANIYFQNMIILLMFCIIAYYLLGVPTFKNVLSNMYPLSVTQLACSHAIYLDEIKKHYFEYWKQFESLRKIFFSLVLLFVSCLQILFLLLLQVCSNAQNAFRTKRGKYGVKYVLRFYEMDGNLQSNCSLFSSNIKSSILWIENQLQKE